MRWESSQPAGSFAKHILHAIDASLRRLKRISRPYQIHRFDPAAPIEETLRPWTRW